MPILCRDAGDRDRVEVDELVAGRWKAGRCRSGSVDEAIRILTARGLPAGLIGQRVGLTERSVQRRRSPARLATLAGATR